jgi:siroheme synthase-like protein
VLHYPIFLNLEEQPVLVVGAGRVALRKTKGLLSSGAKITVVSPEWRREFLKLAVRRVNRRFRRSDLTGVALVFAATNDRDVNHRIAEAAKSLRIPANIADCAEECTFIVPARVQRGVVQIAISTGGVDPRLAKALKRLL